MVTRTTNSSGSEEEPGVKRAGELPAEDRLLVVKDLEKNFGYKLQKKRKAGGEEETLERKELQLYFGSKPESFCDRNFECRPKCDRIPLCDGTYEVEDCRKHRLDNNIAQKTDQCKCLGSEVSEELEGPYYTHLAAAPSVAGMRKLMEARCGESGEAVRIEKVVYTGKEGRTQDGCPIAKWIIRRSGPKEKVLCLVRERPGHKCATAVLCIVILLWDGIPAGVADDLYSYLVRVLPAGGLPTNRRSALNDNHSHRDVHNMSNGCTVVASLTKHRGMEKGEDEQYHVLPLYIPAKTDEHGNEETQKQKMENGTIEVLSKYPMLMRYRKEPLPNCKERNKRPCPSTRPSPPPSIHCKQELQFLSSNPYYPHPAANYTFGGFYPGSPAYPVQTSQQHYYGPQNGFYPATAMSPYGWGQGYPSDYGSYWPKMDHCDPVSGIFFSCNSRRASYGGEQNDCSRVVPPTPIDPDAPPDGFYTVQTDNDHAFADGQIGGVAVAVGPRSILFEVAKKELHATTALKHPDRRDPKRISMVFYQHKNLNFINHGFGEWDRRLGVKKQGKTDTIAIARAAAAKQKFELKLPHFQALNLAPELKVPANRELSWGTERMIFKSTKSDCKIVESKYFVECKKENRNAASSIQEQETSRSVENGNPHSGNGIIKMEDMS